jgi:integrase
VGGSLVLPSSFYFHGLILAFLLALSKLFLQSGVMPATEKPEAKPRRMLSEVVHEKLRAGHYSRRTEEAYLGWIRRFIRFHGGRHPRELREAAVVAFLEDLASRLKVAAATQNQAFNALLFLYREVLLLPMEKMDAVERVRRPARLPEVLSREDVRRVLSKVQPAHQLPLRLLYGTGMRLMELLRLRVKDVDFSRNQIIVHDGKVA